MELIRGVEPRGVRDARDETQGQGRRETVDLHRSIRSDFEALPREGVRVPTRLRIPQTLKFG